MRTPTVLSQYGFNIGDRVRFIDDIDPDEGVVFGQEGVICTFEGCDYENVGVRWDKEDGKYHFCGNFCDYKHGWYVHNESIVAVCIVDLGEINSDIDAIEFLF